MDYLMGIKGRDFVVLCSDTAAVQQIITIKHDEDKLMAVSDKLVLALSGEPGDRVQLSEFVAANVRLAALRGGTPLSTRAVAHYVRGELATALRNRPYQTNLLVAGWDDAKPESGIEGGPSLYWLDYLATCHPMNVAGTGYGSYFVLAMLDALWRPDLTLDEAVALMERGIDEVVKRLVVAPPAYIIKVVDAAGVRTVKTVRPGTVSGGEGGGGVAVPAVGTVQA